MVEQSSGDKRSRQGRPPRWSLEREDEVETFGTWLKKQREARGIELEDIADHTKISTGILHALENDDHSSLPAPVFIRGFLRQYARYVGLDPEVVVSYHAGQESATGERESRPGTDRDARSGAWRWAVLALLLAAAAGGYWIYDRQASTGGDSHGAVAERVPARETQPDDAEPAAPAEAADDEQPPPDPAPSETEQQPLADVAADRRAIRVTIDFVEDCWVESSVDGRRQISTLYAKGESLRLEADERVRVFLGNFSGAVVHINDRPYAWPQGDAGVNTRELVVDQDFLAELAGDGEAADEAATLG